ncbi:MAG TPA: carboxypeptidase-like regulatory domain-containing protein [Pyrinomonadaceae bacterium]|nr:carboxypeptidase-like regulatory domain-containing protein [Pyrinomonadaceae bacterium]
MRLPLRLVSIALVALVTCTTSFSQNLYDSFTDGEFLFSPTWGGSSASFQIVANSDAGPGAVGSNTLRLSAPAVTQTDYLSSQISVWGNSQEWGVFFGRRAQALTAANRQFFWLYATETDLNSATVDGYRIAMGDDSGGDEIRLEYIVDGVVNTTVISTANSIDNGLTDWGLLIRVTRSATGEWNIYTSTLPTAVGTGAAASDVPNAVNAPLLQGTGTENSLVPASAGYIGVASQHTTGAGAIAAAEFDQIYFTVTSGDTTPPSISYTPLGSTQSAANRILTASISDLGGVASGSFVPRIYFRKNAGPFLTTQCSLVSGNAQNGTWDCTINNALIGGVSVGDTIGYFVIAQDTAGNVASEPGGVVATNVNSISSPPPLNTYSIQPSDFSGPINVGVGEVIKSLTNDGGLFQLMNSGTISGNVVVNLTSDLTAETGTHALNELTESGVGGYTIFLQASGEARVIEGSNPTALIVLNGADRVTFSGLAFGPFGLTFRNTGSGATVRILNDSSSNTLLNCLIEGQTTTSAVVWISTGIITGNNDNSLIDNTLRDRSDLLGVPAVLVLIDGSPDEKNQNTLIQNNTLLNFEHTALRVANAEATTIQENLIFQNEPRDETSGIVFVGSNPGANLITQNTIRDHDNATEFTGIYYTALNGNAGSVAITRNSVRNITGSAAQFTGIRVNTTQATHSVLVENNMVSIVPAGDTANNIEGIRHLVNSSINLHYNSVLVGGTSLGGNTWAYRRLNGDTGSVTLIGNLLFNARTGNGSHFAAGDKAQGIGSWSSDYNLFIGTGSVPENYFDLGTSGFASPVDLSTWQAATPARDANSLANVSGIGPFNLANIFVSQDDLHLNISGNNPAINSGIDIGLNIDFDGQVRPLNGVPDIGADEVPFVPTAAEVSVSGRVMLADGRGIRGITVTALGGDLTAPLLTTTSAFGYFRIGGLTAGQTYVITVRGKRFSFEAPARIVTPGEDAIDIDFIGEFR